MSHLDLSPAASGLADHGLTASGLSMDQLAHGADLVGGHADLATHLDTGASEVANAHLDIGAVHGTELAHQNFSMGDLSHTAQFHM
ncbi:hypothetical protein ACRAWG_25110 [Methylobacterium sp. P31]